MKKTVFALILGIMIGSASTAFGAVDKIEAVFAKFNIQVEQEKSVEVEALVYEGTSYYPIRTIAGILDQEVGYEDTTRTISLSSVNTETKESDEIVPTSEINIDDYNMEYIESKKQTIQFQILTLEGSINNAKPTDSRLDGWKISLTELKEELKYWQDLKALKESQAVPTE